MPNTTLCLPSVCQAPRDAAAVGLDRWPLHQPAELVALAPATGDEQARTLHRLAEVGFLPGEVLRVISRGWLRGGPMAVRVGQSTFALRSHEAALLRVRALRGAV
jgi:ferrous iron transport protein A